MAEYIERKELIRQIKLHAKRTMLGETTEPYMTWQDIMRLLLDAPTADVEEVRYGRWEYDFALDGSNFYKCSLCGRQEVLLEKEDIAEWCPYCHCGARMEDDDHG